MLNRILGWSVRTVPVAALLLFCLPVARAQDAATNYKSKCAGCHGADGSGNTPAAKPLGVRDFHSPEVQKESVADYTDIIANGKNKMPKYTGKLKDTEIKDLATYVQTLGKK